MTTATAEPFTDADLIHVYTAEQALEDGVLIDARRPELADVTRQHFGAERPVYLTQALFELIQRAVDHPSWCNDFAGVWHDVVWMSKVYGALRNLSAGGRGRFLVTITGTGRRRLHHLEVAFDGRALTYMLRGED